MSSTITLTGDWLISMGNRMMTRGTGNLGSYSTNGVAVTAAQLGLGQVTDLIIDPAAGYVFQYLPSTGKIKAFWTGAGLSAVLAEVTDSTSLSGITFTWRAIGYD
jgi:hypothetical protein